MKIKSIRIENFRSFQDETISLNRYSCFIGTNGAGKSSILAALNIFFQEQASSATDSNKLTEEDYFQRDTTVPVRITVVFDDIGLGAQKELSTYCRQNELTVSAEAVFDQNLGYGQVRHFGQRLGLSEFRPFFEAIKTGAKVGDLNTIYENLQQQFEGLSKAASKEAKITTLHEYEETNPDKCVMIPSEDTFYGINSTGKLANFVQWIYVPAVKDAEEEGHETKNTTLSKLITRAVRIKTNFNTELEDLRKETLGRYRELLDINQVALSDIESALQKRLEIWAHPKAKIGMEWLTDPAKSVVLQQPIVGIKTGDGDFIGSLARMGHGLQRSYLLALLQELASSEAPDSPTLILGCEEAELYQHPPQARHLADVFEELAKGNNQVLVTTHSSLFVNGEGFENVRLVRRANTKTGSTVKSLIFESLCLRIRNALGKDTDRPIEGMVAKIHQLLQPGIAEMFFAHIPVLVEGIEDVSYITTELYLSGLWCEFRKLGCHLIPVNGKSKLIQPLAIAAELELPVFVIFDADGDKKDAQRVSQEQDNRALISLLELTCDPFPRDSIWGNNHAIWPTNLTEIVKADFGSHYTRVTDAVRVNFAQEPGLEKNDLFIAEWLSKGHSENLSSSTLTTLCKSIIDYARKNA